MRDPGGVPPLGPPVSPSATVTEPPPRTSARDLAPAPKPPSHQATKPPSHQAFIVKDFPVVKDFSHYDVANPSQQDNFTEKYEAYKLQ
jgi:hypothetical protein